MKRLLPMIAGLMIITSCAVTPPAEKISGNYTGQYTYNASVTSGVTATVTKVNDNTCSISFSGSGISPLTIANIGITASSNNTSYALTKTGMTESMSGAVDENNQLSVSYGYLGGSMTFVGNK